MIDFTIRNIVREWADESFTRAVGITSRFEKNNEFQTLTLYTDAPQALVGKDGVLIEKYKARIMEADPHIEEVVIVELNDMIIAG